VSGWLGPTSGSSEWTAQPVGHAIGGVLWAVFWIGLFVLPWWARPSWGAAGLTAYWQLRIWEPRPDGTYPLRWVLYDVLTATVTASGATALAIFAGMRW
jgi:hypothetical protein